MFTNTYRPHVGGVARSVETFAEDLRQRGHHVMIVAPTFPGNGSAPANDEQIVRVPALQNFNGSDFSVRLLLPGQFSHQVEQFSPDIIHSHHPFLLGDAALRTARLRRLPLVFTHHTLYERYTHYVPLDSPTLKRFVIELASCFANLCQVVIAPSQSIAQIIARRGVVSPCKVVPTGIDTEFFASGNGVHFRKKIKIPHRAAVIGHLGRLAFEKNLAYLAEAACRACVENDNVYFLVAGKGPALETIQNIFAL